MYDSEVIQYVCVCAVFVAICVCILSVCARVRACCMRAQDIMCCVCMCVCILYVAIVCQVCNQVIITDPDDLVSNSDRMNNLYSVFHAVLMLPL